MLRSKQILVAATWDSEAKVWVAESDDVPGLVAEADSPESLLAKLKTRIPELLELNDSLFKEYSSLELRVQYHGEDRTTLSLAFSRLAGESLTVRYVFLNSPMQ